VDWLAARHVPSRRPHAVRDRALDGLHSLREIVFGLHATHLASRYVRDEWPKAPPQASNGGTGRDEMLCARRDTQGSRPGDGTLAGRRHGAIYRGRTQCPVIGSPRRVIAAPKLRSKTSSSIRCDPGWLDENRCRARRLACRSRAMVRVCANSAQAIDGPRARIGAQIGHCGSNAKLISTPASNWSPALRWISSSSL
jgi:hypothetical protein